MIIDYSNMPVHSIIVDIAKEIDALGGQTMMVGGYVRDHFLEKDSKDVDVEVFGIEIDTLKSVLEKYGAIAEVGKSFGVIKLSKCWNDLEFDFSIPRRETKSGSGHREFDITLDPNMSFKEASSRRDLTINAIGYDIINEKIHDPHGGIRDINNKVIKHVSSRFSEDPLRVLRVAQFAARFEFRVAPSTIDLCRRLVPEMKSLPRERFFEEFKKLLLKADKPSIGLEVLKLTSSVTLFPELEALIGCQQNPYWHAEGDVWIHTKMVIDEATKLRTGDYGHDIVLMLSCLCHDLGKPVTSIFDGDKWRSPGHEEAGEEPTRSFLRKLTRESDLIKQVVKQVIYHLKPVQFHQANSSKKAIRRLALKVDIPMLVKVCEADQMGRITETNPDMTYPAGPWMLQKFAELDLEEGRPEDSVKPIISGRHLISLGMKPGFEMGVVLAEIFEAQLDELFEDLDQGLEWTRQLLESRQS